MKIAIVLCLFVATALARPKRHPLLAFVGEGEITDWKVVGGRPANPNEFPYQCALLRSGSLTCGSWVINERTIGTAAHCIAGAAASLFSVRCGSNSWSSGGQLRSASAVIPHPQYDSSRIDNDIGIVQLSQPLTIDGTTVQKVILPAQGSDPTNGEPAVPCGWGRTSTNGPIPDAMQTVDLTINGRTQCQSTWGAGVTITNNMVCAGGSESGKGICNGDSGGSLVTGTGANRVIVGTMSFRTSLGCAYGNYPEVYARVANYVDNFIAQNTIN